MRSANLKPKQILNITNAYKYTGLPKIGTRFITKKLGISRFRQTGHVQKIGTLTILPNMPRPKNWDLYLIWAISATFREYPGASFLEKNPKFTF